MYAGEFLSCLGLCIASAIYLELDCVGSFAILLILRMRAEERVIIGYAVKYASVVRWKLFPGVW